MTIKGNIGKQNKTVQISTFKNHKTIIIDITFIIINFIVLIFF